MQTNRGYTVYTSIQRLLICSSFPNMKIIVKILLTYPVTSCEPERSFSVLRRLLNWLRSRMDCERLTHLARMHMHHARLVKISNDEIIEQFVQKKSRRLEFGGRNYYLSYFHFLNPIFVIDIFVCF